MLFVIKHIFGKILGFLFFTYITGKYGYYRGGQKIYLNIQQQNFLGKILHYYIENPLSESANFIKENLAYRNKNLSNSRLSDLVIAQYGDDSLMGYGAKDFQSDLMLENQQRAQVIPIIETLLSDCKKVLEVGCGNGDVLAKFAEKYSDKQFLGIDFSVKNAIEKYSDIKNLEFVSGYALDMQEVFENCGLIYTSSTMCVFTPLELDSYIQMFRKCRVQYVCINEPIWGDFEFSDNHKASANSFHLEGAVWNHSYKDHFSQNGYVCKHLELKRYKHPKSQRNDLKLYLAVFEYEN